MIINNNIKSAIIISNDAGGAEVLSRLCKKISCKKLYYLKGPAKKIFNKKNDISQLNLKKTILQSDILICTTSFNDITYYKAIQFAKKNRIQTLLVLDHWTFYQERVLKNEKDFLPDKIIVFDLYAKKILKDYFPIIKCKLIPNPYLIEVSKKIINSKKNNKSKSLDILYCTDANESMKTSLVGKSFRKYGYNEFEALEFFFNNIDVFKEKINSITIRVHPAEKKDKYNKLIKKYSNRLIINIDNKTPLAFQIIKSNMIVGCETFPMVIGVYSNKRVVCSIPPGGNMCPLPFKEIKYLRKIAK
jgi:hypothetical protein